MKLTLITLFVCLFTVLVFFTPFGVLVKNRIASFDLKSFIERDSPPSTTVVTNKSVPSRRSISKPGAPQPEPLSAPVTEKDNSIDRDSAREKTIRVSLDPSPYGVGLPFANIKAEDKEKTRSYITRQLDAAMQVGAKWVRVGLPWSLIEPHRPSNQDDGRWWILDLWLEEAEKRNLEILLRLDSVRRRDCENEELHWPGVPFSCNQKNADKFVRQTALPDDADSWQRFVANVAGRSRHYVHYFQVGNEVDTEETWFGSPQDYVTLLALTKEALFKTDPRLLLLTAGMSGSSVMFKEMQEQGSICGTFKPTSTQCLVRLKRVNFIDYVLRNGRMIYGQDGDTPKRFGFDIADFHLYEPIENIRRIMSVWRNWLASTATPQVSSPRFWVTESGGPAALPTSTRVTDVEFINSDRYRKLQFREVVGRLLLLSSLGAERIFWWSLIDGADPGSKLQYLGLRAGDYKEKDAGKLFAYLAKRLGQVEPIQNLPSGILGFKVSVRPEFAVNGEDALLVFFTENEAGSGSRKVWIDPPGVLALGVIQPDGTVEKGEPHLGPVEFLVTSVPLVLLTASSTSYNF